jgi:hypothetical protein
MRRADLPAPSALPPAPKANTTLPEAPPPAFSVRDAARGDPASRLLVSALALLILIALVFAVMVVWR